MTQIGISSIRLTFLPSTIHRIEGGGGGITDTTYFKVFDVLGVKDEQIVNFLVERETGRERKLAFNR